MVALASLDSLAQVLAAFGLPEPAEWTLLRRSAVKRDEMARATFGAGSRDTIGCGHDSRRDMSGESASAATYPPVLVRFHDPTFYRRSDISQQTRLRAHLSAMGVPVPRLHTTRDGGLFRVLAMQGEDWAVTVEDWVEGEPPQTVTLRLISGMGRTLAAMHASAANSGIEFGHGTGMSLFTDSDHYACNASRLRTAAGRLGLEAERLVALFGSWDRARDRLMAMWPALPRGPVHADFAEYNLLLDQAEDIAAVIDFNLAGDDVFVNELIHACLRLPSSGEEERDRENWQAFIGAYESVRPLQAQESLAIPYLVTVVRPFRSREVSSLLKAAEMGDAEAVARGLGRLARLADPGSLIAV